MDKQKIENLKMDKQKNENLRGQAATIARYAVICQIIAFISTGILAAAGFIIMIFSYDFIIGLCIFVAAFVFGLLTLLANEFMYGFAELLDAVLKISNNVELNSKNIK